eukprot:s2195_g10.t1
MCPNPCLQLFRDRTPSHDGSWASSRVEVQSVLWPEKATPHDILTSEEVPVICENYRKSGSVRCESWPRSFGKPKQRSESVEKYRHCAR